MRHFQFSGMYNILSLLLGLSIFIFLISEVGLQDFLDVIKRASPVLLMASILMYAFSWVFRTWRLKRLTDVFAMNMPVGDLFKIHIAGFAVNSLLPGKAGDMAMTLVIKGRGSKIGTAAALVFQTRILDVIALIFLLVPAVFILKNSHELRLPMLTGICLAFLLPVLLVTLDTGKRFCIWLERLENRISHRIAKLAVLKTRDAYDAYHRIVFDKPLLLASILLSIGIWLTEGLVTWLIAVSMGVGMAPPAFVLAVILGNVGKSVPITPGGIGVYEGILATALVWFGVPIDVAVVIAICDHFLKKMFNLVWGLSFLPELGKDVGSMLMDPRTGKV